MVTKGVGHGDIGSGTWRHRDWDIETQGVGHGVTQGLGHGDTKN